MMKKIKIVTLIILVIIGMAISTSVFAYRSDADYDTFSKTYGSWNYNGVIWNCNPEMFNGNKYYVDQAYEDSGNLYAWLTFFNGRKVSVRAWKKFHGGKYYYDQLIVLPEGSVENYNTVASYRVN